MQSIATDYEVKPAAVAMLELNLHTGSILFDAGDAVIEDVFSSVARRLVENGSQIAAQDFQLSAGEL